MFESFVILFSIILVHESGHYLAASLVGWEVEKISLYLYGGSTVFKNCLNKSLIQETLVLIAGPLMQILFYFIIALCDIKSTTFTLFESIHYSLLVFNLLPIYPLDGGKMMNIIFSKFLSYYKGLKITLYCSLAFLVIIFIVLYNYYFSLNLLFICCLLLFKIVFEWKRVGIYFNKFMLERYLYDYRFDQYIRIEDIKDMRRDKSHFLFFNRKYVTEKELLKEKFNKRY